MTYVNITESISFFKHTIDNLYSCGYFAKHIKCLRSFFNLLILCLICILIFSHPCTCYFQDLNKMYNLISLQGWINFYSFCCWLLILGCLVSNVHTLYNELNARYKRNLWKHDILLKRYWNSSKHFIADYDICSLLNVAGRRVVISCSFMCHSVSLWR